MILIKDLFTMLGTGEFANLALKRDDQGNLQEAEYEKVINHLNLGVVELYKRFKIMFGDILLYADPTVTEYKLDAALMVATEGEITTVNYLLKPAGNDGNLNVIEIKDIYDADGASVRLNNRHLTPAFKQTSMRGFKITGLEEAGVYTVHFQSHPTLITLNDAFDLDTATIDLEYAFVEALLFYIAERTHRPIVTNGVTPGANRGVNFQQQFELSCQKIELLGLEIDDDDHDDARFNNDGWV